MGSGDMLRHYRTSFLFWACLLTCTTWVHANQETLTDGLTDDGHMTIRGDQYGAFGPFSIYSAGFGRFDPDGAVELKDWQFGGGLMLADDVTYRWLMDGDDWTMDFPQKIDDTFLLSDVVTSDRRMTRFIVPEFNFGDIEAELVQQTPPQGYNFVQQYTFTNPNHQEVSFRLVWFNDQDVELQQTWKDNRVGFVPGAMPRAYFIEEADVAGAGHPGTADRDHRISIIAKMGEGITFDGYVGAWAPQGGMRLSRYLIAHLGIRDEDLNTIQEIDNGTGAPIGTSWDESPKDGLMDEPNETSGAMQFSLVIPPRGSTTMGFNYVGGKLSNAVFLNPTPAGDFNGDYFLDATDIDLLTEAMWAVTDDQTFDLDGNKIVNGDDRVVWAKDLKKTWFGDADLDGEFSSDDFVQVFAIGRYETGQDAGWAEGDWGGNGVFDSADFVTAFADGGYELGVRPGHVAAVPEPTGHVLSCMTLSGLLAAAATRRRCRSRRSDD